MKRSKIYGYCRVSTQNQADEGDSLNAQEENIRRYCQGQNLDVINVYKECISGSIQPENRPLLSHILREINDNNCDGIVVYKLDRLSRNIKDTITLLNDLSQKNKLFFEIKNNLSNVGAVGSFTIHLFSALAQLERAMTIERVNEVIKYRRDKNLILGGIPFGRKIIEKDSEKVLVEDEEEMRTINMIIDLRNTKVKKIIKVKNKPVEKLVNTSFKSIAQILTKEKRKNKEGAVSWFASNVQRIYKRNYCRS